MAIAAPGHEQSVLPTKLNVVRCGLGIVSGVPAFNTVYIFQYMFLNNLRLFIQMGGQAHQGSAIGVIRVCQGNHATSVRPFDGDIDRVALWRRALSASEILNRVGTTLLGTESGLVSYWSFDDGSGQAVRDATINANHGVRGTSSSVESSDPAWSDLLD